MSPHPTEDPVGTTALLRGRLLRLLLFTLAVCGAIFGVAMLLYQLAHNPLGDTQAYYNAATRLNEGEPLYPADQQVNTDTAYFYPPLFAILFRPLALLPYEVAAAIWGTIVVAASVGILVRVGIRRPELWLAVGILGAPIAVVLAVAQAHAIVTLLLATMTPAGVAIAGQIKLFPILAAAWWIGRRDWRGVGQIAAWTLGLMAFQLVLEPQACIDYVRALGLGWVGEVQNLSPYVLSPILWVVAIGALGLAALRWAGTSAGWALAVSFATLAPPRLPMYLLMGLLAGFAKAQVRRPVGTTSEEEAGAVAPGASPGSVGSST